MKININITLITWSKWFVASTGSLALALLVATNVPTIEVGSLTFVLAVNFALAVLVGLRKN